MASPGRKAKPALQVIREGNPGKRPVRDSVKLPPSALTEPNWWKLIPGSGPEIDLIRDEAIELWRRLAPTLSRSVGLVGAQRETLVEYCVTWARIVQGERALSREGVMIQSRYGMVKNGWATILHQYRSHFRSLVGELGLSPASATRLSRPRDAAGDDDDPFDA